jgi:uncharacterized membrane protein YkvA (DUF1232 family)
VLRANGRRLEYVDQRPGWYRYVCTVAPMDALTIAGATFAGVMLLWLVLVLALWFVARGEGKRVNLRDMIRLVPDLVHLLSGLARDPNVPRGVRIRLGALLVYLAFPVDLVPDFIPIIGYADDLVLVVLVLRSVVRRAGPSARNSPLRERTRSCAGPSQFRSVQCSVGCGSGRASGRCRGGLPPSSGRHSHVTSRSARRRSSVGRIAVV